MNNKLDNSRWTEKLKELDPYAMVSDNYFAFFGGGSPFSNFHVDDFVYHGITFCCSEQAFMYAKAYIMNDFEMANKIASRILRGYETPLVYKRMGRKVENYDDSLWSKYRQRVMKSILYSKFCEPSMRQLLLATGDRKIIEASPYDRIWGAGVSLDDIDYEWNRFAGENLLGRTLMELRDTSDIGKCD